MVPYLVSACKYSYRASQLGGANVLKNCVAPVTKYSKSPAIVLSSGPYSLLYGARPVSRLSMEKHMRMEFMHLI